MRLICTLLAGALLGAERSRTGHPAGLRTTLLVTLAASIAMIQMNLLIPTNGKPRDSYAVMDLMRLPLGILTGVGFIGAGAIVRKDEMVLGITTAATMWYATVVGLCLGGGQIYLGLTATLVGFLVLWILRFVERSLETDQRGTLTLTIESEKPALDLRRQLEANRIRVKAAFIRHVAAQRRHTLRYEVRWRPRNDGEDPPEAIAQLRELPGVVEWAWGSGGQTGEEVERK